MFKLIAIVALLLSAIGFAMSLHMERAIWGRSVTLPLPPMGYSVVSTFQLNSSGLFKVEVQVPSLSTGKVPMRDKPALAVNLDMRLERSGGNPIEIHPTLYYGGEIGFSQLDLYFSDPINLPSGEYVLRAKTLSAAPPSALLTLNPVLNQSGRIIAIDLLRVLGWIFLFVGVVAAALGSWLNSGILHYVRISKSGVNPV